ncbi:MAG: CIA30 family protein [Bacteroidota bacterium]
MKAIFLIAGAALLISFVPPMLQPSEILEGFDFGQSKDGRSWLVMNDGVMGGLSSGESSLLENSIKLEGKISLANRGGFSSVRSPWRKMDLSNFSKVNIRYRSNGQVVAIAFETHRRWWRPYYLLDLETTDGAWKTVSLNFHDAKEISIVSPTGKQLEKAQLEAILRIGFMTHEKKESPFEFEADYLKFE